MLLDVNFDLSSGVCCVRPRAGGRCILVGKFPDFFLFLFLLLTEERSVAKSLLFVVDQISTLAKKQFSVYIKSLFVYCF